MIRRIRHFILGLFRPVMVGRFKKTDGAILPFTRVSNTTHIGNIENLSIGDNVFIGHFNFIDASNGLTIGEGCQITNYVSILTHSSHISIRLYGDQYINVKNPVGYVTGKVELGPYCFIGPHSVIMPGTTLGKGSIVSAFSYVKDSFPDFSIVAGNPAVVIGDTRNIDRPFLEKHPELVEFYKNWSMTDR